MRFLKISVVFIISWLCINVSFAQYVNIAKVDPSSAMPGQEVEIKGTGFDSGSKVYFSSIKATNVTFVSSQLLKATVPAGAPYGFVTVNTASGLTAYSPNSFMVNFGGVDDLATNSFTSNIITDSKGMPYEVCLCDVNSDSKSDIILSHEAANGLSLYLNNSTNGTLSLSPPTSINISALTRSVDCGDLNGDGVPELVAVEFAAAQGEVTRIFILTKSGTSYTLNKTIDLGTTVSIRQIKIYDVDKDGKPDLVFTDQELTKQRIGVLRNTSSGTINFDNTPELFTSSGGTGGSVGLAIGDFNLDGQADVAFSKLNSSDMTTLKNASAPNNFSFTSGTFFSTGSNIIFKLLNVDVNDDGKPDIVLNNASTNSPGAAYLLNNSSDASLSFGSVKRFGKFSSYGIGTADFNGDGMADFFEGSPSIETINFFQGGKLNTTIAVSSVINSRYMHAADINNDGKPDAVYTKFRNGAGQFGILINENCATPIIYPEGPITDCTGDPVILKVQSLPGAVYSWSNGGSPVGTNSPTLSVTSSGDYSVSITQGGCTKTSEIVPVTINAPPGGSLPTINAVPAICPGSSFVLSASGAGPGTIEWRGPNNFSDSRVSVEVTDDFRLSDVGTYYLDIYGAAGCLIKTESVLVQATDIPEFQIVPPSETTVCGAANPIDLEVSVNDPSYDYQWFRGGGTQLPNETSYKLSGITTSGTYYAKISNVPGCTQSFNTNEVSLSFLEEPAGEIKMNAPSTICKDQPVQFSIDGLPKGDFSYVWNFGNGRTSTQASPELNYTSAGDYTVNLTIRYSSAMTCKSEQSKDVKVLDESLSVDINASQEKLCEGEIITLSATDGLKSYNWNTGDNTSTIDVAEAGEYAVQVSNDAGCIAETVYNITQVIPAPEVVINTESSVVQPEVDFQLIASGLDEYHWEPADLLSDSTISDPFANIIKSTLFKVYGEDLNGCYGESEIQILIEGDQIGNILKPKNFFSPNKEDDINALWVIEKIEQFPQCSVSILDQTGNILYEAQPYNNEWDGTSNGVEMPSGVYYYIIKCDGSQIAKSGSITLLR